MNYSGRPNIVIIFYRGCRGTSCQIVRSEQQSWCRDRGSACSICFRGINELQIIIVICASACPEATLVLWKMTLL